MDLLESTNFLWNTRPWYSRYGLFIIIYLFLWFLSLLLLVNLISLIIQHGYTYTNDYFTFSVFFIFIMLLFLPFRYKTFEKRKHFGLTQSKYVAVSENSLLNSSMTGFNNLKDYEAKLEKFFTIENKHNQIWFSSKTKRQRNYVTILAWLTIFVPTLFVTILAILIVRLSEALLLLVVLFVLFYRLNIIMSTRDTFYQIMFSDTKLLILIRLKNGKSHKINSINLSDIDYVSYQQYQSDFRIIFGNADNIVPFLDKYSQEDVETIYQIIGQFLNGLKHHTISS